MSAPAIAFENVTKEFSLRRGAARVRALDQLSLTVPRGEVVALLGPNGSGKSTALKIALGLIEPSEGKVSIEGSAPTSAVSRQRIGFVPDSGGLPLHLTAREALDWWGRINDLPTREMKERVGRAVMAVDLNAAVDRRIAEFSRGMKQRLVLAQALLLNPEILLLDEPFSGVDSIGIDRLTRLLAGSHQQGCTILLSSHLLSRVEEICDRVVLLHRGRKIGEGTVEEIMGAPFSRQRGLDDVFKERIDSAEDVLR